jgi:hypothetical protein
MGVYSDGSAYGVAEGIFFSMPCIMCVLGGGGGAPTRQPVCSLFNLQSSGTLAHTHPPPYTHTSTRCSDEQGKYTVVKDLAMDDFARSMIAATEAELLEERAVALSLTE